MAKNINRKVTIYINGKEVENTIDSVRKEVRCIYNLLDELNHIYIHNYSIVGCCEYDDIPLNNSRYIVSKFIAM